VRSYGLDTSVVLRLLVGAPAGQAQRALEFLKKCSAQGIKVFVSDLVVLETYHAFSYHYQVPVEEAVGCLTDFLSSEMVTGSGHALAVLKEYPWSGPGLADRLIRRDLLEHASIVLTFDKKFSHLSNMKKL